MVISLLQVVSIFVENEPVHLHQCVCILYMVHCFVCRVLYVVHSQPNHHELCFCE